MWSGFVCKNAISGLLPIREPKHNDGSAIRRLIVRRCPHHPGVKINGGFGCNKSPTAAIQSPLPTTKTSAMPSLDHIVRSAAVPGATVLSVNHVAKY
jgi:hypothetical protein